MFPGPHDPRAPNWNRSGLTDQIEINDVALAVRAGGAWLGLSVSGRHNQGFAEYLGICLPDANGCEDPRLMSATRMMRVQAVLFEFSAFDNGPLAIRQLHLGTSVADRCLLTIRLTWLGVSIGQPRNWLLG